jgi:hypothetical protein
MIENSFHLRDPFAKTVRSDETISIRENSNLACQTMNTASRQKRSGNSPRR